jgi:hypothetical protein
MVALGYGKFVRAADIVALLPIEDEDRGRGRRTYVHVAGIDAPIVASRSAAAILADMGRCPAQSRTEDMAHGAPRTGLRWRRRGAVAA